MKNIIALITSVFLLNILVNNLFAQEKTISDKPENTFNFYFINGYAISYNFYNADSYFLRVGIDLSTTKQDIDSDGESVQEYSGGYSEKNTTSGNADNSYFSIGASAQIVWPVFKNKYGMFYLGAGPLFNYSNRTYSSSESRTNSNPGVTGPYKSSNSTNEKNYDVGAIFLVGLNAILTENFAVFVEANIKGGGRWQNTEAEYYSMDPYSNYNKNSYSSDGNGWFYEAQFIRMGISISL